MSVCTLKMCRIISSVYHITIKSYYFHTDREENKVCSENSEVLDHEKVHPQVAHWCIFSCLSGLLDILMLVLLRGTSLLSCYSEPLSYYLHRNHISNAVCFLMEIT